MSSVDYNAIVAQIDSYVVQDNGDVSLRCGSLGPDQVDDERLWSGEVATGTLDATTIMPTLGDALSDLARQIGLRGGQ